MEEGSRMTRFARLTLTRDLMLGILESAPDGLGLREWSKRAREAGVNPSRPSTVGDVRLELQAYGSVTRRGDKSFATSAGRTRCTVARDVVLGPVTRRV